MHLSTISFSTFEFPKAGVVVSKSMGIVCETHFNGSYSSPLNPRFSSVPRFPQPLSIRLPPTVPPPPPAPLLALFSRHSIRGQASLARRPPPATAAHASHRYHAGCGGGTAAGTVRGMAARDTASIPFHDPAPRNGGRVHAHARARDGVASADADSPTIQRGA